MAQALVTISGSSTEDAVPAQPNRIIQLRRIISSINPLFQVLSGGAALLPTLQMPTNRNVDMLWAGERPQTNRGEALRIDNQSASALTLWIDYRVID
jgi:hypothetical protein